MWSNKVANIYEDVNGLHLIIDEINHIDYNSAWRIERKPPMRSRLIYFMDGDLVIKTDSRDWILEPGYCYLIPTGCSFTLLSSKGTKQMVIHTRLMDSNGLDSLKECKDVMRCPFPSDMYNRLSEGFKGKDILSGFIMKREIYDTLHMMFKHNNFDFKIPRHSHEVIMALEYIKSNLSIQLAVEDVAAKALVSVSTLTKKFKSEIGTTVSTYLQRAVMTEALDLLLNSPLTVQEISERLGFCYQSYFSRRFKLWYNITPQQCRSSMHNHIL